MRLGDFNGAGEVGVGGDGDDDAVFREDLGDFLRPFDQAEAVSGKVFLYSDVVGFLEFIYAVEVKVVDRKTPVASVFVDDGECWTVYDILDAKGFADGLDEGGLAGTHLSVECKDVALEVGFRDVLYEFLCDLVYFLQICYGKSFMHQCLLL